ncbi:MAG TPA: hypothetical protein VKX49_09905 [Bryobacteraceae bacterium]|nr:hypothetical protein [Bryobacteraceae bacterium]
MNSGTNSTAVSAEKLAKPDRFKQIEREFLATGDAHQFQNQITRAVDEITAAAYASAVQPALEQGTAVIAVAGYGRKELFPHSDLGLLILLENESPWVSLREILSEFVRELWDAGLRVTHSVRTLAECLDGREGSAGLSIALLDRRFVAGDPEVFAKLDHRFPAFLSKHVRKLSQDQREQTLLRHAKFFNTVRNLQPDVRESPGGLRDLQLMAWLAKLGTAHPQSPGQLRDAAAFLSRVRCFLHLRTGGDNNFLDFDSQQSLVNQPFLHSQSRIQFMRDYYRHAAVIFNHARRALEESDKPESSLLGSFRDWRTRLSNTEFTVSRDHVLLRNPGQLETDPMVVIRLMEFMARHAIALAADTERRMEAARPALAAYFGAPRPLWPELSKILALPHFDVAVRAFHELGLLTAIFPEWGAIEDLALQDPARWFSVDEHTVRSIERVTELRSNADATRQRFAQVLSEVDRPAVLFFALLCRDLGRQEPAPDAGTQTARSMEHFFQAAARIGMPLDVQQEIAYLIQHEADLCSVISGRDIGDDATVRFVDERAGTVERLKQLTILAYADTNGSSKDSMSAWRLEQLWRIYQSAHRELTRELETERIREVPPALPNAEFIKGLPARYLRAHSSQDIASHLQLYELSRPTGVAVQIDRIESAYRLTLIARDRPCLFASIAGALSSFGLDILKAEAFSNAIGSIVDTFIFADPRRTLELNPPELERLQDLIRRVALGKTDGQRLLRNRAQPESKKRRFEPQVQFDSEACETATLVEIIAEDRPGLLYSLASVFSSTACNIDVVLIDTKGQRAIDVFYVAHEGRKLSADMQALLKQKLLAVC